MNSIIKALVWVMIVCIALAVITGAAEFFVTIAIGSFLLLALIAIIETLKSS